MSIPERCIERWRGERFRKSLSLDDEDAVSSLAVRAEIDQHDGRVTIDGHDVTRAIRTPEMDRAAACRGEASSRTSRARSSGSRRLALMETSSWKAATSARSCSPTPRSRSILDAVTRGARPPPRDRHRAHRWCAGQHRDRRARAADARSDRFDSRRRTADLGAGSRLHRHDDDDDRERGQSRARACSRQARGRQGRQTPIAPRTGNSE